jgi:hypothetical protein
MKQNHGLPPANTLSDEKQSAWIAGMKVWDKENPLDKPARNSLVFGITSTVVGALLIAAGLRLNHIESYLAPLLGIPFGYALYFIANRRYQKWDIQRRDYSDILLKQLHNEPEPTS